MKNLYYHAPLFVLGLIMTGTHSLAFTENRDSSIGENTSLVEQATFTPRKYCQTSGGQVSETSKQHVYLCCYQSKKKCIAIDTQASVSWIMPFKQ